MSGFVGARTAAAKSMMRPSMLTKAIFISGYADPNLMQSGSGINWSNSIYRQLQCNQGAPGSNAGHNNYEMQKEMAIQTDGNVGADEAKAEQADGNKGDGSFGYRSPEGMASISFGSDGRRPMSRPNLVDPETVMVAQIIVGFMLFAAGVAVGKLL